MTEKLEGLIIWGRHIARDRNSLIETQLSDFICGILLNRSIDMP